MRIGIVLTLAASLITLFCSKPRKKVVVPNIPIVAPEVVRIIPHDSLAFTQGLVYANGRLYESTGLYGRSTLRVIDTTDGRPLRIKPVSDVFAEGLALFHGKLIQLTWKESMAFVYDTVSLGVIDTLHYSGEGWGLASGPGWMVMSNGSSSLFFRNASFTVTRRLTVKNSDRELDNLNELEYARGRIYANVWYNDFIFEIDPESGLVTRMIDCTHLVSQSGARGEDAVLNGIAYNPEKGTFYVTGKNWPTMFEVKIPS